MRRRGAFILLTFLFVFFLSGCDFFNPTTSITTATTTQTTESTASTVTTSQTSTITTQSTTTTTITTVLDELSIQLRYIYNLAVGSGSFDGTYEEWLETVRGPQGIPGQDGQDGQEVMFRVNENFLQWRYEGETTWTDLLNLNDLNGQDGEDGVGIESTRINNLGELIIVYTDSTEVNLGVVVVLYTVNFRDFNGYLLDSQRLAYGSSAIAPNVPDREGYTFIGWDKAFDDITENLMITALYEKESYTVEFLDAEGNRLSLQTVLYGEAAILPGNPLKEGHTFIKWDLSHINVKSDLIIRPEFAVNTYQVTFKDYNGMIFKIDNVPYMQSAIPPINVVREGYNFLGWDRDFTNVTSNLVVNALYEIKKFTIYFEVNGGLEIDPMIDVEYGSTVTLPTPDKDNHEFLGWFMGNDEGARRFYSTDIITSDLTVYAKWKEHMVYYTVTYSLHDVGMWDEDVLAGSYLTPPEVSKYGHSIDGWYIYQDVKWDFDNDVVTSDITLNAMWQINTYTLRFETFGGTEIPEERIVFQGSVARPDDPIKEGYEFGGWFYDDQLLNEYYFTLMPGYDLTIYAKWIPIEYELLFLDFDGTIIRQELVQYNADLIDYLAPIMERVGYTFIGFDESIPEKMPAMSLTFTALYEINQYKITFITNINQEIPDLTFDYDEDILLPEPLEVAGYTFLGWFMDSEGLNPFTLLNMPASDLIVYAIWAEGEYAIIFLDDDGTLLFIDYMSYGEDLTSYNYPVPDQKVGYTFLGWDSVLPDIMPDNDIVLTATYQVNQYTITYHENGGTDVGTITYNYMEEINLPNTTKEGYVFIGWYLEESFDTLFVESNMPAENLELFARWETSAFTISYYDISSNAYVRIFTTKAGLFILTEDNRLYGSGLIYMDENSITSNQLVDITGYFNLEADETIVDLVGTDYYMVLTSFGRVLVVGSNAYGQLGDGTYIDKMTPVDITENFNLEIDEIIVYIAVNNQSSFAVTSSGRVFSFGLNNAGQLGNGTLENKNIPFEITEYFNFEDFEMPVAIAGGSSHTVVITNYNRVFAFGWNQQGQLGLGYLNGQNTLPIDITNRFALDEGEYFLSVSANDNCTYVVTLFGKVYAFGYDPHGLFGQATSIIDSPMDISYLLGLDENDFVFQIKTGSNATVFMTVFNRIFVLGNNVSNKLYISPDNYPISTTDIVEITDRFDNFITDIYLGFDFALYFDYDYNYYVIGKNTTGVLATGDNLDHDELVRLNIDGLSMQLINFSVYAFNDLIQVFEPTRAGFVFDGWYMDRDYQVPFVLSYMPDQDVILFAKWQELSVSVVFETFGGTVIADLIAKPGDYFMLPTPSKEGFVFGGWYEDANYEIEFIDNVIPDQNITLYAKWLADAYEISFYDFDGVLIFSKLLESGTLIDESIIPQGMYREGYSFIGFDPQIPEFMPEASLSFTALYQINEYNIFFIENGGSLVTDLVYEFEEEIYLPKAPTKDGYFFMGWYLDDLFLHPFDHVLMPAYDLTLYALWLIDDTQYAISNALNADVGTLVTIRGSVYGVLGSSYNGFYITDPHNHIFISYSQLNLSIGDYVEVKGVVYDSSGVLYLSEVEYANVIESDYFYLEPWLYSLPDILLLARSNETSGLLFSVFGELKLIDGAYHLYDFVTDTSIELWVIGYDDNRIDELDALLNKFVILDFVLDYEDFVHRANLVKIEEASFTNDDLWYLTLDLIYTMLGDMVFYPGDSLIVPVSDPYDLGVVTYEAIGENAEFFDNFLKVFTDTLEEVLVTFEFTYTIQGVTYTHTIEVLLSVDNMNLELSTIAEFLVGPIEDTYLIQGVVVMSSGEMGQILLKDATGQVYMDNPFGLEIGDEVVLMVIKNLQNHMYYVNFNNIELVEVVATNQDLGLVIEQMTFDDLKALDLTDPSIYGKYIEVNGFILDVQELYHANWFLAYNDELIQIQPTNHMGFEKLFEFIYLEVKIRAFIYENDAGIVLHFQGIREDIQTFEMTDEEFVVSLMQTMTYIQGSYNYYSFDKFMTMPYHPVIGGLINYEVSEGYTDLLDNFNHFVYVESHTVFYYTITVSRNNASISKTFEEIISPLDFITRDRLYDFYNYERVLVKGIIVHRNAFYAYLLDEIGNLIYLDIANISAQVGDEVILVGLKRANYDSITGYKEVYLQKYYSEEPVMMILSSGNSFVLNIEQTTIYDILEFDPQNKSIYTTFYEVEGRLTKTEDYYLLYRGFDFIVIEPADSFISGFLDLYLSQEVRVIINLKDYDSSDFGFIFRLSGIANEFEVLDLTDQEKINIVKEFLLNEFNDNTYLPNDTMYLPDYYQSFMDMLISYQLIGENTGLFDLSTYKFAHTDTFAAVSVEVTLEINDVIETFTFTVNLDTDNVEVLTVADMIASIGSETTIEAKVISIERTDYGYYLLLEDETGKIFMHMDNSVMYYNASLIGHVIRVTGTCLLTNDKYEIQLGNSWYATGDVMSPIVWFTEIDIEDLMSYDFTDASIYGEPIMLTGYLHSDGFGRYYLEANGYLIGINKGLGNYDLAQFVNTRIIIKGFLVGTNSVFTDMISIMTNNYSYDDGYPFYLDYHTSEEIAEFVLGKLLQYAYNSQQDFWPKDMHFMSKNTSPFMNVTVTYEIIGNSDYYNLTVQPLYDDYLEFLIAPEDQIYTVQISITHGDYTAVGAYKLHLNGFTPGTLADLFLVEPGTKEIALEAEMIYKGWGFAYFLIEDQIYYHEGYFGWINEGTSLYIIGKKAIIDGVADYTYDFFYIESGYQGSYLTPVDISVDDLLASVDLDQYRSEFLNVFGVLRYDDGIDMYYLEGETGRIYLRMDMWNWTFSYPDIDIYLNMEVYMKALFSPKMIRNEFYVLDFRGFEGEMNIKILSDEEKVLMTKEILDDKFNGYTLKAGDMVDLIDYLSIVGVALEYELVDEADAVYLDMYTYLTHFVEASVTVELLVNIYFHPTLLGTHNITIQIEPRPFENINDVLVMKDNSVVAITGLVVAASSGWFVLQDESERIYVKYTTGDFGFVPQVGDELELIGSKSNYFNYGLIPYINNVFDMRVISSENVFSNLANVMTFMDIFAIDYNNPLANLEYVIISGVVVSDGYGNYYLQDVDLGVNYEIKLWGQNLSDFSNDMQSLLGEEIAVTGYLFGVVDVENSPFDWILIYDGHMLVF